MSHDTLRQLLLLGSLFLVVFQASLAEVTFFSCKLPDYFLGNKVELSPLFHRILIDRSSCNQCWIRFGTIVLKLFNIWALVASFNILEKWPQAHFICLVRLLLLKDLIKRHKCVLRFNVVNFIEVGSIFFVEGCIINLIRKRVFKISQDFVMRVIM